MQTDAMIQALFKSFQSIKWRDCEENKRFEWYYAEDNHYVVREKVTKAYWFISAKSPSKACESVLAKLSKSEGDKDETT